MARPFQPTGRPTDAPGPWRTTGSPAAPVTPSGCSTAPSHDCRKRRAAWNRGGSNRDERSRELTVQRPSAVDEQRHASTNGRHLPAEQQDVVAEHDQLRRGQPFAGVLRQPVPHLRRPCGTCGTSRGRSRRTGRSSARPRGRPAAARRRRAATSRIAGVPADPLVGVAGRQEPLPAARPRSPAARSCRIRSNGRKPSSSQWISGMTQLFEQRARLLPREAADEGGARLLLERGHAGERVRGEPHVGVEEGQSGYVGRARRARSRRAACRTSPTGSGGAVPAARASPCGPSRCTIAAVRSSEWSSRTTTSSSTPRLGQHRLDGSRRCRPPRCGRGSGRRRGSRCQRSAAAGRGTVARCGSTASPATAAKTTRHDRQLDHGDGPAVRRRRTAGR